LDAIADALERTVKMKPPSAAEEVMVLAREAFGKLSMKD
jgi:hypothetical protein